MTKPQGSTRPGWPSWSPPAKSRPRSWSRPRSSGPSELNPELNAIIHPFYEEAIEEAGGDLPDGPFRGVPFLRKDLGAALAGEPLHMGSRLLKEIDFRSPFDSTLALRFRDAGLVTIGKTNTPEWGILPTTEPVAYGATRNPWDPTRSPGRLQRRLRGRGRGRASCRSPTPTTAAARSASRPASTAWSA